MQIRGTQFVIALLCVTLTCSTFVGCHQAPAITKLAYISDTTKPLQYYKDVATEIAYPTDHCERDPAAFFDQEPRYIFDPGNDKIWNLSLREALRTALENGAIIKDDGSFGSPANPVLANPNGARTAYDIGIQESGILFGNRGVEAALGDFDAQWQTTMTWARSEQIQNSANLGLGQGDVLQQDQASFSTQVQKTFANSGIFTVQHDMNYSYSDVTRQFPSAFDGFARMTYRQPLLAGSGPEFTRIAGPIGSNLTGVSGVAQGVVISRINTDIAISDIEGAIATMIRDVENRYWDLQLAYLTMDAERVGAAKALEYWQRLVDRLDAGPEEVASAKATYQESIARVQNSIADINDNEARLRRLMGLKPRDGRVIRPTDKPTSAVFTPDWTVSVAEAMSRRPELRSQKWNIKSLELQLKAAKGLARPRLDAVAQYQWNAFGDQLFGGGDAPGSGFINDSAYESLLNRTTANWNLGFQLAFPIGFRTALTQVRNYEFRVRKARAMLAAQENEIAFEVGDACRQVERWQTIIATNREGLAQYELALEKAQEALTKLGDNGASANTFSRLLTAHINAREARIRYFTSLNAYNKALTDLNFRKGSTLAENNVHMSESLWCPSAYDDALRRAWARTYAKETSLKSSFPLEITDPAPQVVPLAQTPPPRELPNLLTSEPKPKDEDENTEAEEPPTEDDPELNFELPKTGDEEPEAFGETVLRTGLNMPMRRVQQQPAATPRQPQQPALQMLMPRASGSQKAGSLPAHRVTPRQQAVQPPLERRPRRTGASKAS